MQVVELWAWTGGRWVLFWRDRGALSARALGSGQAASYAGLSLSVGALTETNKRIEVMENNKVLTLECNKV